MGFWSRLGIQPEWTPVHLVNSEAVDYALRSVISLLDPDLDKDLANIKGFSVYPHVTETFISLYEEYAE